MEENIPPFAIEKLNELIANAAGHQAGELQNFLLPVLVLVCWTLLMWIWMYATRVPAMQKAKINPDDARHPGAPVYDAIPANVRAVADNYNHLHEQPTIFYALMGYAALTGGTTQLALYAAWAYVGLRILHSLIQTLSSKVMLRFLMFCLATLPLFLLAGIQIGRALG